MTDPTTHLLRYLLDRFSNALDNSDGDGAVTILHQIRAIDPTLAERLLDGLLRVGMRRLTDHLSDAIRRHDTDTVVATLTQIRAIDPQTAAELTNHLIAAA